MALLQQVSAEVQAPPHPPARIQDLPRPRNMSRGFWGTLHKAGIDPGMAWPVASKHAYTLSMVIVFRGSAISILLRTKGLG